jgi:hypothetical protein
MKFTINGAEYEGAKLSYITVWDLKSLGFDITDFQNNPWGFLRAYFSISSGMPLNMAGDELEEHLTAGGDLNGLSDVIGKEVETSGFFQALRNRGATPKRGKKPSENTEA